MSIKESVMIITHHGIEPHLPLIRVPPERQ